MRAKATPADLRQDLKFWVQEWFLRVSSINLNPKCCWVLLLVIFVPVIKLFDHHNLQKSYTGLWFQGSGRGGMAVNNKSKKLSDHIFNCNYETERKQWEMRWGYELPKPILTMFFLQQGYIHLPKQQHQTTTKCSNTWAYGETFPFKTTVFMARSIWFGISWFLSSFTVLLDLTPSQVPIPCSWLHTCLYLPRGYPVLYKSAIFTFGSKESYSHQYNYLIA